MRFKNARVSKNAFKDSFLQWNAGAACVSERVLETLARRGLRVGPSKRFIWLQLQFFFVRCFVGIRCCNVILFLCRISETKNLPVPALKGKNAAKI